MERGARVVIVENNLLRAAKLSLQLDQLGYHITGIFSRAKEALSFIKQEVPDVVLLDERLTGKLNGFEKSPKNHDQFPVIHFNEEQPAETLYQLLSKIKVNTPIKNGLEKTFQNLKPGFHTRKPKSKHFILKDRIFIRDRDKMLRIALEDIHYIEADRNYCRVHTKDRQYLLVTTLKEVDEKLMGTNFLRIHRSFIANIAQVDEIGLNYVIISKRCIPLSKAIKGKLLEHLQII